jgi:hypothetical protein
MRRRRLSLKSLSHIHIFIYNIKTHRLGHALEQAHAAAEALLEVELAAHGRLRDLRHLARVRVCSCVCARVLVCVCVCVCVCVVCVCERESSPRMADSVISATWRVCARVCVW